MVDKLLTMRFSYGNNIYTNEDGKKLEKKEKAFFEDKERVLFN